MRQSRAPKEAVALNRLSSKGFARRFVRMLSGSDAHPVAETPLDEGDGAERWIDVSSTETWREFDLAGLGGAIEISALMSAAPADSERSVVARVRLTDRDGVSIDERLQGLRISTAAGRYFYPLEFVKNGAFRFSLRVPPGAAKLAVAIQRWRRADQTPFTYKDLSIRATGEVWNARADSGYHGLSEGERRVQAEKDLRLAVRLYANRLLDTAAPLYADDAPFGEPLVEYLAHVERSSAVAERLALRRLRAGRDLEAMALGDLVKLAPLDRAFGRRQLHAWADELAKPTRDVGVGAKSVVYLMHNCQPFDSGGYAARAHGLLRGFQKAGWAVHAFARPGYPADKGAGPASAVSEAVDGVTYNFLPSEIGIDDRDQVAYIQNYAAQVLARLGDQPVGYVQAASFFHNAFAGRIVADKLGVPLVYEMRGMDWLTRGSSEPRWNGSPQEVVARELELKAARCADRVLAITSALRDWLIDQGIEADRIGILPNGCSPDQFEIRRPDPEMREELGLAESAFVVGYVGSVVGYEGLPGLVAATKLARELSGRDIRLLVVGDGLGLPALRAKILELDAIDWAMMTGRVPHAEVPRYYSVIDVVGIVRKDQLVTQMISPLKPLEALAMGKPLIVTDVAAVREIIEASGGGVIVPNKAPHALAHAIIDAAEARDGDAGELEAAAEARRSWAETQRDWAVLAARALEDVEAAFPAVRRQRLGSRRAS